MQTTVEPPETISDERTQVSNGLNRWLLWGPIFLGVVALLGLLGWGMWRQQAGSPGVITNDGPALVAMMNRPASDFQMALYEPFNGKPDFRLSDYQGKTVVINFWASWCPPCIEEAEVLEQAWRIHQSQDVVFVGVNIWDSEEDAGMFLQRFGITYPNIIDERGKVAVQYGMTGLPETYFIQPDGMISRKIIGAVSLDAIAEALSEISGEGQ